MSHDRNKLQNQRHDAYKHGEGQKTPDFTPQIKSAISLGHVYSRVMSQKFPFR
jgi:hypothetical protein